MAKKVFMIAPFEAMTGNLSGEQNLQYAENNNPAYEAPNGTQYARNYHTRYIGARRGRDGLVYFQVKQTTATVLKASTRRSMAVIGVTAAIRSALMKQAATWSSINNAFAYLKDRDLLPEGQDTFNKWFCAQVKNMLVYKHTTWSFTQASISFNIVNPFALVTTGALSISQKVWIKFVELFAIYDTSNSMLYVCQFDGKKVVVLNGIDVLMSWEAVVGDIQTQTNIMYKNNLQVLSISGNNLAYLEQTAYLNDVAVAKSEHVIEGAKYTTAAPL